MDFDPNPIHFVLLSIHPSPSPCTIFPVLLARIVGIRTFDPTANLLKRCLYEQIPILFSPFLPLFSYYTRNVGERRPNNRQQWWRLLLSLPSPLSSEGDHNKQHANCSVQYMCVHVCLRIQNKKPLIIWISNVWKLFSVSPFIFPAIHFCQLLLSPTQK